MGWLMLFVFVLYAMAICIAAINVRIQDDEWKQSGILKAFKEVERMGLSKRTEDQAVKHYDREEKREALMSYFRCRAEERKAEDRALEFMLARSAVNGIAYDKIGGGGSDPKLQEDYLAEQRELEEAVDRARSKTRSVKEAVIKWIQNTGEEKEGILRIRFIVGMDVGIIAMINTWSRRHTERKIMDAIDALPAIPAELLDMS